MSKTINQELKECLLCKRIEFNEIALSCFLLWDNDDAARKVAIKASELVKEVYTKNPPLLCGRAPKTIMAAVIYIAQFLVNENKCPQFRISEVVGTTEVSIRNIYPKIIKTLNLGKIGGGNLDKINLVRCCECRHIVENSDLRMRYKCTHPKFFLSPLYMDTRHYGRSRRCTLYEKMV